MLDSSKRKRAKARMLWDLEERRLSLLPPHLVFKSGEKNLCAETRLRQTHEGIDCVGNVAEDLAEEFAVFVCVDGACVHVDKKTNLR